jgi:hypothetical protein
MSVGSLQRLLQQSREAEGECSSLAGAAGLSLLAARAAPA